MQKQNARIKCKNHEFIQTVRSIKTTAYDQNNNMQWYFHIFGRKKVQSPAKQFKELFSLCPNHFRWKWIVVCEVQPCLFLILA